MADGSNNDELIAAYEGQAIASVTLQGRTFWHDGTWNTLCLPFPLSSFGDTPLEGATVKTLESTSFSTGTLTMNFSQNNLTAIEAGKPYIVKWNDQELTINYGEATPGANGDNADRLFDGKTNTKWCAYFNNSETFFTEFSTSRPAYITAYTLTTGGDTQSYPNRNPKKWTLLAKRSLDDSWTEIDSRNAEANTSDQMPTANQTAKRFAVATPGAYRYFRLEVTEPAGTEKGGSGQVALVQLSELSVEESQEWQNPVFSNVVVSSTNTNIETGCMDFIGSFSPVSIYEAGDKKTNLYLGSSNTLYYPTETGFAVNAMRGYFKLKDLTAGKPSDKMSVRAFNLNFGSEETGIADAFDANAARNASLGTQNSSHSGWYTLDGRRITEGKTDENGLPQGLKKGIYVANGRKVVVRR